MTPPPELVAPATLNMIMAALLVLVVQSTLMLDVLLRRGQGRRSWPLTLAVVLVAAAAVFYALGWVIHHG